MSINDFHNKIKNNFDIDKYMIVCLLTIVIVGISAFGLGRLSINNNSDVNSNIIITNRGDRPVLKNEMKEKRYVASKNGKLFYGIKCLNARKILLKNIIWFGSVKDALEAGYKQSSSC